MTVLCVLAAAAGRAAGGPARRSFAAAAGVVALGFVLHKPFECRVRALDDWYRLDANDRPRLKDYAKNYQNAAGTGLLDDVAVRDAWLDQQTPAGGGVPKVVMVCVSGGARKASLFTAAPLFTLAQSDPAFG